MPAFTPTEPKLLDAVADAEGAARPVAQVATATNSFEGAGFPVRRPFPGALDLRTPTRSSCSTRWARSTTRRARRRARPTTRTAGSRRSPTCSTARWSTATRYGGGGVIHGGETQWMTAGRGLVHSEMPTEAMMRDGGHMHGVQLWVNLPRADKRGRAALPGPHRRPAHVVPQRGRRRDRPPDRGRPRRPPRARGARTRRSCYAHATLQPGAHLALDWPREFNALVYVLSGRGRVAGDAALRRRSGRRLRRRRRARGRRRCRRRRAARGAAPRWQADPRAGVLLRPLRDEHQAGDHRHHRGVPALARDLRSPAHEVGRFPREGLRRFRLGKNGARYSVIPCVPLPGRRGWLGLDSPSRPGHPRGGVPPHARGRAPSAVGAT